VTTIRSGVLFALIILRATTATAFAQNALNLQGTLTINLTDTRGLKLPRGKLSIKSNEGSIVYAAEVGGQAVIRLPYGRYTITFEADWFRPARRDVVVDGPECFVELAATFVPEGGSAPGSISIKVDPATSCASEGSLWAKLIGVYSQEVAERHVGSAGFALFEPVESGTYVVIVVDGQKIRAAFPVAMTIPNTVATIVLSPCGPK
jgi:hypothetical protein